MRGGVGWVGGEGGWGWGVRVGGGGAGLVKTRMAGRQGAAGEWPAPPFQQLAASSQRLLSPALQPSSMPEAAAAAAAAAVQRHPRGWGTHPR